MKTVGEIAFDAFNGLAGVDFTPAAHLWEDEPHRERWERAARAVIFAAEDMSIARGACATTFTAPVGIAPNYGAAFTCLAPPDPFYPGYLAKVRT